MSLYADYLKERTDDQIIETDTGFVTYRYLNNFKTVYIVDIYTVSHSRGEGRAAALANLVIIDAKEHGATELLGTVYPAAKNATESMKALLGYGMKIQSVAENHIILRKDI